MVTTGHHIVIMMIIFSPKTKILGIFYLKMNKNKTVKKYSKIDLKNFKILLIFFKYSVLVNTCIKRL